MTDKKYCEVKCPKCRLLLSSYSDGTAGQKEKLIKDHQEETEIYLKGMAMCEYWKKYGHEHRATANRALKKVNKLFGSSGFKKIEFEDRK